MKLKFSQLFGYFLMSTLSLMIASPLTAHEFLIKPAHMHPGPDSLLPFSVLSAHVFMVSEEMEPADQVVVDLISGDDITAIPLAKNQTLLTLDGAAKIGSKETPILSGHRKGMIWCNTTQGWKQCSKKGLTGVISSGKYEKFCKTLLSGAKSDTGYDKKIGHTLEIVPLDNPAEIMLNDEAAFQILFKGKPLSTEVRATYDGFSHRANTYAYVTSTDENGIAHVRIDHNGLWMVRVENKTDDRTEDYDTHVIRSILIFEI